MKSVSDEITAVIEGSPHYKSYLIFDNFTLSDDEIYSIETTANCGSTKEFIPGTVVSSVCKLEVLLTKEQTKKIIGQEVQWNLACISSGEEVGQIPMGIFTVYSCEKNGDKYTVQGTDKLSKADDTYNASSTVKRYQASSSVYYYITSEIMFDISEQIGARSLNAPTKKYFYCDSLPEISIRQMLGYISSISGCTVIINGNGMLTAKAIDYINDSIIANRYSELNINEQKTQASIVWLDGKISDHFTPDGMSLDINNPYAYTIENPYISKDDFQSLKTSWLWGYYSGEIPLMIADPRIEPGDVINVEGTDGTTMPFPVMELNLKYDGGLSGTVKATAPDND
ncbi:MAG: hypothetical protein ACI4RN_04530 [Oscillospiraceae bacterium]